MAKQISTPSQQFPLGFQSLLLVETKQSVCIFKLNTAHLHLNLMMSQFFLQYLFLLSCRQPLDPEPETQKIMSVKTLSCFNKLCRCKKYVLVNAPHRLLKMLHLHPYPASQIHPSVKIYSNKLTLKQSYKQRFSRHVSRIISHLWTSGVFF